MRGRNFGFNTQFAVISRRPVDADVKGVDRPLQQQAHKPINVAMEFRLASTAGAARNGFQFYCNANARAHKFRQINYFPVIAQRR